MNGTLIYKAGIHRYTCIAILIIDQLVPHCTLGISYQFLRGKLSSLIIESEPQEPIHNRDI